MPRRLLLSLSTFFLLLFVYEGVVRMGLRPWLVLPTLPGGTPVKTLILVLFSLTHALYALGARHTLVFFLCSATISWAFEQVGVATGFIYGPYHYTDALGTKLGQVPILIPLAWFMMIYPSYVIANLIADHRPTSRRGGGCHLVGLSMLSAGVMTSWDLLVEPVFTGPTVRAWVWEQGGPYFGVPLQNFVGWMLTTFTVYLAYRLFEHRHPPRPMGPLSPAVAVLPLIAYAAMMVYLMLAGPAGLRVIGPFAMGWPLLAVATRLLRRRN